MQLILVFFVLLFLLVDSAVNDYISLENKNSVLHRQRKGDYGP